MIILNRLTDFWRLLAKQVLCGGQVDHKQNETLSSERQIPAFRPYLLYTEAFDGPNQFTRQGGKPENVLGDLADRTSFATPQMDWFSPPRTTAQAGISRFPDFVMLRLWSLLPIQAL